MFQKYIASPGRFVACLTILVIVVKNILAYDTGAPPRICDTMLPSHGEQSMEFDNIPFKVQLDKRFIRGTGKITIEVTATNPSKQSLKGALFIMKQRNNKLKAFGTFDPATSEKDLKTIACFGKPGTGLTHSHKEPKTKLRFQWSAPNDTKAEYELHATFVRDFNTFWADYIHPEKIFVSVDAPASAGLVVCSFTPLLLASFILAFTR